MKNQASVKSFIKIVRELLPSSKKLIFVLLALTLVYEAIKFVPPYLVKLIIDGVIDGADMGYLFWLVGAMFLILCIMGVISIFSLKKVAIGAASQQSSLLSKTFKKVISLPLSWHEKQSTGNLVSKLTKASNFVNQLFWFINNDILPSIIQLLLTGVVLFWVDYRLGLIYLVFSPLILYSVDRQFRKVQPYREKYHQAYEDSTDVLAQSLYNIRTVKDFAKESYEEKVQSNYLADYLKYHKLRAEYEFFKITTRDILTNFVRSLSIGVSIYLVYLGALTPGDLVFVFTIVEKAFINLHRLGRTYIFMGDTYESLDRNLQILNTQNTLKDNGRKKSSKNHIEFENVSFSYDEEAVLKDISINIPSKKTTALVGPSGSGKTTIVKLIARHYDPDKGKISIGGVNLKDLPLKDLRQKISFVSQHTEMFNRTIHQNIAYSNPKATRRQVINAAKKANAHEFISAFKDGYDTIVGEQGVRLSGGQQQRISIARALLSKSKIIIFDEATSSLDSQSENLIQSALLNIKNKTMIIIAHRLSTIQHSDNIIVLHEGEVLEQGTHSDLISKGKGLYKNMRQLQKLGEIRK